MTIDFDALRQQLGGALFTGDSGIDNAQRILYSTDASVYQEKPIAVAIPKTVEDLKKLIHFANKHHITLIPRAAGTSLAGQVVGKGIVVDISKHFTKIVEVNEAERWVRVQPGVIRDDLNKHLAQFGLMFGPETSTANRAMIGGMVGNNSCGLHSIVWGASRDHLLETKMLLSDGSETVFGVESDQNFQQIISESSENTLKKHIYSQLHQLLSSDDNQELIRKNFPKKTVTRRNTGYALDALLQTSLFSETWEEFNLCKLIAGAEGTLGIITEVKLGLLPLPPKENGVICIHCTSLNESLKANLVAMRHRPSASELVDKYILDYTIQSPEYRQCRFFIEGDPAAILMVEYFASTREEITAWADKLIAELKTQQLGYAYPLLFGDDSKKAWDVRKGGLGLLRNKPGNTQPVNLIEDCAVAVEDLPDYITDLEALLKFHNTSASFYAHAGAGELHVEPMINLKTEKGRQKFRRILQDTAALIRIYNGSLSGEHGDGRLRGEFISVVMGEEIYNLFRQVKNIFDPNKIFNAGKIIDTPAMNEFLRYEPDAPTPQINTYFDFTKQEGILRLTEKCSGSGDCRKTHLSGGTMCPSYMATRQEKDTTRARANILRQFLTHSHKANHFNHEEIKEVMDLCLSCKGCKSECPSGVDVAKMKAEFLQNYYDVNGVPFRAKLIGNFSKQMNLAAKFPFGYNLIFGFAPLRRLANGIVGFHPDRTMPKLSYRTFTAWFKKHQSQHKTKAVASKPNNRTKKIYLFADEFTNYHDVSIGKITVKFFEKMGYEVAIPKHIESGRTYLSKGMLKEAREIAIKNVQLLSEVLQDGTALVGIEPSAILTLRDEYLDLVPDTLKGMAEHIAENTYLLDEYIAQEIDKKNIRAEHFKADTKLIKLHGHCHQKALSSLVPTKKMLSLPANYEVQLIPSGCCGMAGSFGYEKEHYDVSMQIGELVLFPTIRKQAEEVLIAAPGTSCRHQIKDGTGRRAYHPIEILWDALV
jgi:FAD/FMN-containing dehydrogenase/Fe-S oxidoreductase